MLTDNTAVTTAIPAKSRRTHGVSSGTEDEGDSVGLAVGVDVSAGVCVVAIWVGVAVAGGVCVGITVVGVGVVVTS
jgi:hypothetical protein